MLDILDTGAIELVLCFVQYKSCLFQISAYISSKAKLQPWMHHTWITRRALWNIASAFDLLLAKTDRKLKFIASGSVSIL